MTEYGASPGDDEWRPAPAPPPAATEFGSSGMPADVGHATASGPHAAPASPVRTGRAPVRGLVRDVQQRRDNDYELLAFRAEQFDRAGNRLEPAPVELVSMRGIIGQLGEGESIEADGVWQSGTLRVKAIRNLTTGATVRGRTTRDFLPNSKGCLVAVVVAALALVGVIAAVVITATNSHNGTKIERSAVAMPDVVGLDTVSAFAAIGGVGLNPSDIRESGDKFCNITKQSPAASTTVKRGDPIVLTHGPTGRGDPVGCR